MRINSLWMVILVLVGAGAPSRELPLLAEIQITGDVVTLADLVPVSAVAAEDPQRRAWQSVRMSLAPNVDQELVLNRTQVLEQLGGALVDLGGWTLKIPDHILVARAGQSLDEESVTRAFEQALRTLPVAHEGELHDVRLHGYRPFRIPQGPVNLDVSIKVRDSLTGSIPAEVLVSVRGEQVRRFWVQGRVSREVPVWLASRELARGEVLGSDAGSWELRDEEKVPHRALSKSSLELGVTARSTIRAGTLVTEAMVEVPPAVKKGDVVSLRYESGALSISTRGLSMRDAAVNEVIPIKNLSSDKMIFARVVGVREAVVEH